MVVRRRRRCLGRLLWTCVQAHAHAPRAHTYTVSPCIALQSRRAAPRRSGRLTSRETPSRQVAYRLPDGTVPSDVRSEGFAAASRVSPKRRDSLALLTPVDASWCAGPPPLVCAFVLTWAPTESTKSRWIDATRARLPQWRCGAGGFRKERSTSRGCMYLTRVCARICATGRAGYRCRSAGLQQAPNRPLAGQEGFSRSRGSPGQRGPGCKSALQASAQGRRGQRRSPRHDSRSRRCSRRRCRAIGAQCRRLRRVFSCRRPPQCATCAAEARARVNPPSVTPEGARNARRALRLAQESTEKHGPLTSILGAPNRSARPLAVIVARSRSRSHHEGGSTRGKEPSV